MKLFNFPKPKPRIKTHERLNLIQKESKNIRLKRQSGEISEEESIKQLNALLKK